MWLIGMIAVLLLSLWAQQRVQSTFRRFAEVPSRFGRTGAQVARLLLDARGLQDVKVERVGGFLSDHYDPTAKTLRLSEATHDSPSVAAIGVAAHEAGHALQHADAYRWLGFRSVVVPVVSISSKVLPIVMMLVIFGMFAGGQPGLLGWIMLGLLGVIALFTLITLPVEFDASRRALVTLDGAQILQGEELTGARKVLDAAALTYVAAAIAAVFELVRWAFIMFAGRGGSEE
jgi:Zn-dependent membrane protease YugP